MDGGVVARRGERHPSGAADDREDRRLSGGADPGRHRAVAAARAHKRPTLFAVSASASVVVSGVNLGQNTGLTVLFSGTVGAALAAANLGLSALAISIDSVSPFHLATATAVAAAALDWLVDAPVATVLNVNVPDLPLDRLAGVRHARLASFGTVQRSILDRQDGPYLATFERLTQPEPDAGTDGAYLRDGWVTVSALLGIRTDDSIDVAPFIERAVTWAA
ncbi:MAG: 5'/3'-nucleotidase SurE [Actinomycetes bacterium]